MAASGTLACDDVAAVGTLAARLAPHLKAGDAVLFEGPIGVGKTHLIRALVTNLESADAVTSPTYTIMHVYETGPGQVLHLDAYRLSGVDEYRDLGIEDLAPEAITLVEWGDQVAAAHPEHLHVRISHVPADEGARTVTLTAVGARWDAVVAELAG
ncbi:MAG: tRNA (adenosine(37)-N6)-threonylcarbamoyltransferase complex ATPase subunit type 1 TsaE [Rhodospirillales bacterium]|nr:tRNA (adenosine(37)-N6)-threonylcarbamoyltransferase complex ATPase subunit type 1 TsaE [Rhodospirillales bacterium]